MSIGFKQPSCIFCYSFTPIPYFSEWSSSLSNGIFIVQQFHHLWYIHSPPIPSLRHLPIRSLQILKRAMCSAWKDCVSADVKRWNRCEIVGLWTHHYGLIQSPSISVHGHRSTRSLFVCLGAALTGATHHAGVLWKAARRAMPIDGNRRTLNRGFACDVIVAILGTCGRHLGHTLHWSVLENVTKCSITSYFIHIIMSNYIRVTMKIAYTFCKNIKFFYKVNKELQMILLSFSIPRCVKLTPTWSVGRARYGLRIASCKPSIDHETSADTQSSNFKARNV